MFAEGVSLRDWNIVAHGKDSVLKENKNIFDSVETIQVFQLALYEVEKTVVAELEITINNEEKLLVVDVITFDDAKKITSIRAYRGN